MPSGKIELIGQRPVCKFGKRRLYLGLQSTRGTRTTLIPDRHLLDHEARLDPSLSPWGRHLLIPWA